jgi:hypothetical protein
MYYVWCNWNACATWISLEMTIFCGCRIEAII